MPLRDVSPAAARVEAIKDWRSGFVNVGHPNLSSRQRRILPRPSLSPQAGLDSCTSASLWTQDGTDRPLLDGLALSDHPGMDTFEVIGRNERRAEFSVPALQGQSGSPAAIFQTTRRLGGARGG